jgi:hypothetical protein
MEIWVCWILGEGGKKPWEIANFGGEMVLLGVHLNASVGRV